MSNDDQNRRKAISAILDNVRQWIRTAKRLTTNAKLVTAEVIFVLSALETVRDHLGPLWS